MFIKEGTPDEYLKIYISICPVLVVALKDVGISDYYIFLDEGTRTLFASYNINAPFDDLILSSDEVMKKWWLYMKGLMVTNIDNSSRLIKLKEIFNL